MSGLVPIAEQDDPRRELRHVTKAQRKTGVPTGRYSWFTAIRKELGQKMKLVNRAHLRQGNRQTGAPKDNDVFGSLRAQSCDTILLIAHEYRLPLSGV